MCNMRWVGVCGGVLISGIAVAVRPQLLASLQRRRGGTRRVSRHGVHQVGTIHTWGHVSIRATDQSRREAGLLNLALTRDKNEGRYRGGGAGRGGVNTRADTGKGCACCGGKKRRA